ncbi:hypothetical protein [Pseudoalteromonas prydzensis]|uniref:hypothetical protein n=1 Tax=Pseudoalteromonas prydzensis TaxID=182141 RepID=UPI0026EFDC67|nr:hypothetical protein [Pseudoalteromonas prydzensis]
MTKTHRLYCVAKCVLSQYQSLTLRLQQVNFAQLWQSCINDIPSEQIAGFLISLINQWLERGWLVSATT